MGINIVYAFPAIADEIKEIEIENDRTEILFQLGVTCKKNSLKL